MGALLDQVEVFEPRLIALRDKLDNAIIRYDAWFLVLLVVLGVIAVAVWYGMSRYCTSMGRSFSGSWHWTLWGIEVKFECV